jgi:anti-sigma factor ChrR (cupin superfamily)
MCSLLPDPPFIICAMLNMDFSRPVTINTLAMDWVASPAPGVWRKPLSREEAERGHATSIVKYEAGASFRAHNHPLGEEILVLEGTFSDETGDFHAGTYFRNPKGFVHAPFSKEGCVILVKLHQFDPDDITRLAIRTAAGPWRKAGPGLEVQYLHEFRSEQVAMLRMTADATGLEHEHPWGEEMYVIEGAIRDEDGTYPAGTWLRRPPKSRHCPVALQDSLIWVKSGHLGKKPL